MRKIDIFNMVWIGAALIIATVAFPILLIAWVFVLANLIYG